jgi:hypothetical protein
MRFEVLTAQTVKTSMLIFWVVTLCGLVGRYQSFGGTRCLHFSFNEDGSIMFLRNVGIYLKDTIEGQQKRSIF